MKRCLLAILMVLAILLPASRAIAQDDSNTNIYVVGGSQPINVRACPHLNCAIVTTLPSGSTVTVLEKVQGDQVSGSEWWYRTSIGGTDAYIHSSLIAPQSVGEAGQGVLEGYTNPAASTTWVRYEGTGMSIEAPPNWENLTADEDYIRMLIMNSDEALSSDVLYAEYSNYMILAEADLGLMVMVQVVSQGFEVPPYISLMNTTRYLKDSGYEYVETSLVDLPAGRAVFAHYGKRSGSSQPLSNECVEYLLYRDRVLYDLYIFSYDYKSVPEDSLPVFEAMVKSFEITSPSEVRHALSFNAGAAREGENSGTIRSRQAQLWTYDGQAGELMTISTNTNSSELRQMTAILLVRSPSGEVIAERNYGLSNRTPQIQQLELPETGIYEIEIHAYGSFQPSTYKLNIRLGKILNSNM